MIYSYLDDNKNAQEKLKRMLPVFSDYQLEDIFSELESEYEINSSIKK